MNPISSFIKFSKSNLILFLAISLTTALVIGIGALQPTFSALSPPCDSYGDVDGDGDVDSVDSLKILRYVAGEEDLTPQQKERADVNNNGEVDSVDSLLILRYVSGLDSTFSDVCYIEISISANPSSGTFPLFGVQVTAEITSGTVSGPTTYTFYCDRSDSGTDVTLPYDARFEGISVNSKTIVCNYPETNPDIYNPKVIVERPGVLPVEARASVKVTAPEECSNINPDAPTLVAPANGVSLSKNEVTFSWNSVSSWGVNCLNKTRKYHVYLDRNPIPVTRVATLPEDFTSFTKKGLLYETTYYWKVCAYNGVGVGCSEIRSFTTPAPSEVTPPEVTPPEKPETCPGTFGEDKYNVCYFKGTNFNEFVTTGTVSGSRFNVDLNWGSDVIPEIGEGDFVSVILRGKFYFNSGDYNIKFSADDGLKIIIDGNVIYDNLAADGTKFVGNPAYGITRHFDAGYHKVEIFWNELAGDAYLKVTFRDLSSVCDNTPEEGKYYYCKYGTTDFNKNYWYGWGKVSGPNLNYNWGTGQIGKWIDREDGPTDRVSLVWRGNFNFDAGDYQLVCEGDDGVKVVIDNKVVVDKLSLDGTTTAGNCSKSIGHLEGKKKVEIFWNELVGAASLRINFKKIDQSGASAQPPPSTGWCSVETLSPYFGDNAETAAKICNAESGGNPLEEGADGEIGLFQIKPADYAASFGYTVEDFKEYLKDPINNIKAAVKISKNGTYWRPWSTAYKYTCLRDSYIQYLGLYDECVPWHQCGSKYASANGFNCWRCVGLTCP